MSASARMPAAPARGPIGPATKSQRWFLVELGADPNAAERAMTYELADEWIRELRIAVRSGHVPDELRTAPPGGWPSESDDGKGSGQAEEESKVATKVDQADAEVPSFERADRVAASLLVRPEVPIDQMVRVYNAYREFHRYVMSDPDCYDVIDGAKAMNRNGAVRLGVAFGLDIEILSSDSRDVGNDDALFVVRARAGKGARHVDAVGTSRLSEVSTKVKELGAREHQARARAETRAVKRAIYGLLGGSFGEAEE